jgi:uncharacterized protein HemX
MEFLFISATQPVEGGIPPQVLQEVQATNIALPVALSVVAVVAVAVIGVGVYFGQKKYKMGQQRVRLAAAKSLEQSSTERTSARPDTNQPTSKKWTVSNKPSAFKNTAADPQ